MLRAALLEKTLAPCRRTFERFVRSLGKTWWSDLRWGEKDDGPDPEWAEGEAETGSWHKPWTVRHWNRRPAAAVISALVKSWAWPVVEEISGTSDIAVLLGLCLARHAIDVDLGVGAHQDAKGLPPMVPFSVWVPMHDVTPRSNSGLGFVVGPPDCVLPTLPHGDVGPDYFLEKIDRVWVPTYRAGDLTIHTNYMPHFTTGYGRRRLGRSTTPVSTSGDGMASRSSPGRIVSYQFGRIAFLLRFDSGSDFRADRLKSRIVDDLLDPGRS